MPLRCSLLVVGCILLQTVGFAQPQIKLLSNVELTGATWGYKFDQNNQVLKRGGYDGRSSSAGIGLTYGLGLHVRLNKSFAFEAGYQKMEMDLYVHDKGFFNRNNDVKPELIDLYRGIVTSTTNYDAAKLYNVGYLQVYYFTNTGGNFQPYLSAGAAKNFLDSRQTWVTGSYQYHNEHTTFTADFKQRYVSGFVETGVSWGYRPMHPHMNFFMGVKFNLAGRTLLGDYANSGGSEAYTDHVTASGSYMSFTMRIGYTFGGDHHKKKRRPRPTAPKTNGLKIRQNMERMGPYRTP